MTSLKAGAHRLLPGLILAVSATALPAAQAAGLRIGSVESIAPTEISNPRAASGPATPGRRELRFDAFGRRFDLQLEATPGMLAASTAAGAEALQGTASGLSGSWVRLTKIDGGWSGVIFDGVEYFAIDPAGAVAAFNPTAARLPPRALVAYRLRDAHVEDASFAGDLVPAGATLDSGIGAVAAELPPIAAAQLTQRLDVGVVLDAEQVALDTPALASAKALARMNVADGIFRSQIGVSLQIASTTALAAGAQPFDSTVPETLLTELRTYRSGTALQQAAGITHLFTGRDMDGTTVGIAYLGSLCQAAFSASLSEGRKTAMLDGLIAAHEIGHVFGAPHDGETGSACASTTDPYLMAQQVNGSQTFSPCSLTQITPVVAAARCLAPFDAPDAALGAALQQRIAVGQPSTVHVTVQSNGNATVNGVQFVAQLPVGVEAAGAGATGSGTCTIVPGRVECNLGNIPAGESRDIEMSLVAAAAGTTQATLSLTAQNDQLSDNDTSVLRLVASAGADLGVNITFDPTSVVQAAITTARVQVRNFGNSSVSDLTLTVTQDAGLTPLSVTGTGLTCTVASGAVTCPAMALASGATAELLLMLQAGGAVTGAQRVRLHVSSATLVDPQPGNNDATGTVTVTVPPPVTPPSTPPASSGGGGGGAFDATLLLALAGAVSARRRRALSR